MHRPVLLFALFLSACGGAPVKKLCDQTAECEPNVDVDACVDEMEQLEEIAKENNCTKEYKDFVKCWAKNGECVDEYLDTDQCDSESLAIFFCAAEDLFEISGSNTATASWSDTGY